MHHPNFHNYNYNYDHVGLVLLLNVVDKHSFSDIDYLTIDILHYTNVFRDSEGRLHN